MKQFDISRPDKLLLSGLKSLTSLRKLNLNLYSERKSASKGTGDITFIGEKKIEKVKVQLYKYNEQHVDCILDLKEFSFFKELSNDNVYWLNFHGFHDVELIRKLGSSAALDRITVRQILDTTLRPKVEEHEHYLFFSVKSVLEGQNESLKVEQLSFILGENYVISLQEELGDHFDHIRNKIKEKLGILRKKEADFLLYQLLDAILDNYFETIESINQEIGMLEAIVLNRPSQEVLVQLESMKRISEMIKKSLNPFKDALKVIFNRDSELIRKENHKYFRDLMGSCMGAIEEIEATHNSLESLTNIYFSSLSQKMNETMKVLTTVATIFIPLTFIAGVYGMNFENMPELKNPNGYFYVLGVMGAILLVMLAYFKRKNWL